MPAFNNFEGLTPPHAELQSAIDSVGAFCTKLLMEATLHPIPAPDAYADLMEEWYMLKQKVNSAGLGTARRRRHEVRAGYTYIVDYSRAAENWTPLIPSHKKADGLMKDAVTHMHTFLKLLQRINEHSTNVQTGATVDAEDLRAKFHSAKLICEQPLGEENGSKVCSSCHP